MARPATLPLGRIVGTRQSTCRLRVVATRDCVRSSLRCMPVLSLRSDVVIWLELLSMLYLALSHDDSDDGQEDEGDPKRLDCPTNPEVLSAGHHSIGVNLLPTDGFPSDTGRPNTLATTLARICLRRQQGVEVEMSPERRLLNVDRRGSRLPEEPDPVWVRLSNCQSGIQEPQLRVVPRRPGRTTTTCRRSAWTPSSG